MASLDLPTAMPMASAPPRHAMPIITPELIALAEVTSLSLLPAVTLTVSVTLLSLPLSFAARAGMVQIISAHSSIISAANFFIVFMAILPLSSGSRFAAGFFHLFCLGLFLVLFGRFAVERRHQHR